VETRRFVKTKFRIFDNVFEAVISRCFRAMEYFAAADVYTFLRLVLRFFHALRRLCRNNARKYELFAAFMQAGEGLCYNSHDFN